MRLWPFGGNPKPKPFTCLEYWLYLPRKKLPPQAAYMARMQRVHPFNPGEPPPVTVQEVQLFSDIRLHIALILREKNVHVFRPDLFPVHVEPSKETLAGLAESESFAKLQYIALEPLEHDRHLRFMPYLVEAVADLTKARVVFDVAMEDLLTMEAFKSRLESDQDARSADFHVRAIWSPGPSSGFAATRGLVKVGLPELETPESSPDHQVVIMSVLEEAARRLWNERAPVESMRVEAFDDIFEVRISYRRKGPAEARILRLHS